MIGRSAVIKLILCGLLIFGFGVIVLNFISYNRRQTDLIIKKRHKSFDSQKVISTISNTIQADFKLHTKPEKIIVGTSKTLGSIQRYKISIKNEKLKDIFVRESGEGNFHILLLHGQKFSSKIWEDIGTLQYLSNWGYRAFAIDFPINEINSSIKIDDKQRIQWFNNLINSLQLKNLVIISPSISGRKILPYIFHLNEQQDLIRGFIPIAPSGTIRYRLEDFKKIKIPTLIVHGENDVKFQHAFKNLQHIPTSEILLIKNASHVSYYDKPIEFHNGLRQFLYKIYRPIYQKSLEEGINKKFSQSNSKLKSTKNLQV